MRGATPRAIADYNNDMQKALIFAIALVVVLGTGFFIWSMVSGPESSQTTNPQGGTTGTGGLNNSTSVVPIDNETNTPVSSGSMTVATQANTTLEVKDFRNDSSTVADTNNKGLYALSGGLDPSSTDAPYGITYTESDQSFSIALLKEPLRDYRKLAERELMDKLGISEADACGLRYWVSTPTWVNPAYSTKNLGFSFCPGAVELP